MPADHVDVVDPVFPETGRGPGGDPAEGLEGDRLRRAGPGEIVSLEEVDVVVQDAEALLQALQAFRQDQGAGLV